MASHDCSFCGHRVFDMKRERLQTLRGRYIMLFRAATHRCLFPYLVPWAMSKALLATWQCFDYYASRFAVWVFLGR